MRYLSIMKILFVVGFLVLTASGCKKRHAAPAAPEIVFPSNQWMCNQASSDAIDRWVAHWAAVHPVKFPAGIPEMSEWWRMEDDILIIKVGMDELFVDDVKLDGLAQIQEEVARRTEEKKKADAYLGKDFGSYRFAFEFLEAVPVERFQSVLNAIDGLPSAYVTEDLTFVYRSPVKLQDSARLPEPLYTEMMPFFEKATPEFREQMFAQPPVFENKWNELAKNCPPVYALMGEAESTTETRQNLFGFLKTRLGPAWVACGCKGDIEWLLAVKGFDDFERNLEGANFIYRHVERTAVESWLNEPGAKRWNEVVGLLLQ